MNGYEMIAALARLTPTQLELPVIAFDGGQMQDRGIATVCVQVAADPEFPQRVWTGDDWLELTKWIEVHG